MSDPHENAPDEDPERHIGEPIEEPQERPAPSPTEGEPWPGS